MLLPAPAKARKVDAFLGGLLLMLLDLSTGAALYRRFKRAIRPLPAACVVSIGCFSPLAGDYSRLGPTHIAVQPGRTQRSHRLGVARVWLPDTLSSSVMISMQMRPPRRTTFLSLKSLDEPRNSVP